MLTVVTGPFHPDLEQALADEIRRCKAADPHVPLAIIAPSALLVSRLRELLVLEETLPLLNVHLLTFHQLALRLYEEQRVLQGDDPSPRPLEPVPDLFFEFVLSRMARTRLPGSEALRLSGLPPGAWTALWATVRDLKDASVDPGTALRGVAEGLFEPEDAPALQGLFTLYAALLETAKALGVGGDEDFAAAATPWVPASRFLARLGRVCYYGFYDLTQVQLSLLEQVARHAPVTLYFPLGRDPAFTFARRFFERHLLPLIPSAPQAPRFPDREVPPAGQAGQISAPADQINARPAVCVFSAIGSGDELTITCKEILQLVETQGYRFEEIGVVARTLEPYRRHLRRAFDQHRIPLATTALVPVMQDPVAKAVGLLAKLPGSGFYRAAVMDLLTSPFYRGDATKDVRGDPEVAPRPDLWQLMVRALGITRGEEEWRRLESAPQLEVWVGGAEDSDRESGGRVKVPPEQVKLLSHLVSRLIRDCRALPATGSVGTLAEAFLQLLSAHLAIPGLTIPAPAGPEEGEPSGSAGSAIRTVLDQIRQLDLVGEVLGWEEWVRLFSQALERATMPIGFTTSPGTHPGVWVLDAMAARGLPFRALFLLGLNEKVFPRFIREDAFLRDRHRRVLAATMGFKIDEKLAGYDEEHLLFALLRQAARQRLYLLFQRADGEGRPLAPSAYLVPFRPDCTLPRRFTDRLTLPWFRLRWLTREELALWLVLRSRPPIALLEACGREGELFRNGWAALQVLEGRSPRLGPHDGLLESAEAHWEECLRRGVAPTPLEEYARCPFRYFGLQVLGLTAFRRPDHEELPARALGELCHAVLRICYQRLVGIGWPDQALGPGELQELLAAAVEESFAAYAADHGTGHALTWQMAKETVTALARDVVLQDQQEFRKSGYRPAAFEVEAEGSLEQAGPAVREPIRVRGRLDRVDRRTTPPGFRIVDYKYRQGRAMHPKDRDLLTSALRGIHLQPPLYALMSLGGVTGGKTDCRPEGLRPELVEFLFLAPRWRPPVGRSPFAASAWAGPAGRQLRHTLGLVLEGIREGRFFILPGDYCDQCELAAACRRFHGPTWWRARLAAPAERLRLLRTQKVSPEGSHG